MKNRTLTHYGDPAEIIDSGYGKINYREWCEKERDRINAKGDGVQIVTNANGEIALARQRTAAVA